MKFAPPREPSGSVEERIRQLYAELFRLTQQLNAALAAMETRR